MYETIGNCVSFLAPHLLSVPPYTRFFELFDLDRFLFFIFLYSLQPYTETFLFYIIVCC